MSKIIIAVLVLLFVTASGYYLATNNKTASVGKKITQPIKNLPFINTNKQSDVNNTSTLDLDIQNSTDTIDNIGDFTSDSSLENLDADLASTIL